MRASHISGLLTGLIFLSPFISLTVKSGYTYVNLVLVLLWLVLFFAVRLRTVDQNDNGKIWFESRSVAWSVWIFVAISFPIDLHYGHAWGALGAYVPFVLLPAVLWLFKWLKPTLGALWLGAAWGAMLGSAVALYQIIALDAYRATVHSSAISFGNTGILLACASMVGFLHRPAHWNALTWNTQMLLGVIGGVLTSMLSGSKGGWMSLVMLLTIFLLKVTKGWTLLKRGLASIALVLSLLAVLSLPSNPVLSRMTTAYEGLTHWLETGRDAPSDGSVGPRLSMWKFGVGVITERPIMGFGPDDLALRWQQEIDAGRSDPRWGPKGHLHNDILTVYLWRGLIGLAAMLAVYAVAFRLFWKNQHHPNTDVQGISFMGMMLVVLYLEFGLTDVIWFVNANRQIFLFWLIALAGLLYVYKRQDRTSISNGHAKL